MGFDEINGNSFFKSTQMLQQLKYSSNPIKQKSNEVEEKKDENIEIDFTNFRAIKAGLNPNTNQPEAELQTEQVQKPSVSFVEQNNT